MISKRGRKKNIMSDNIFNRVGSELSETAITGMLDEEIKGHKKEEAALPIIKLALPSAESTVKVRERSPEEKKKRASDSLFQALNAENMVSTAAKESVIKLPDSLTISQKMRKMWRFRRYGMLVRETHFKRPVTPLPMLKDQDKAKLRMYRIQKDLIGTELLLPAVIIFLLFSVSPIIKTFAISMQSFTTINQSAFIGLDNFVKILADIKFWEAFMHSVSLSLIVVLLGTWMPFILALYVYEMKRGSGLMKVLYFIPFLTPAVPAAILWKWMYNQGFGLINSILSFFTPHGAHIGWLTDSHLVLLSIALVFVWKNTGWAMLIYMAGLQNIPKNLFEDASLNGANVWTKIREIIIPALVPVIAIVIFMQIISGLQVFTEVYIMTNGGPEGASEVIATYIYKKAFLYMDIGYASGVAVFFLFMLVSVTLLRMNLLHKRSA
jgi:ABC-type sugar transport system permease subunit